MTKISSTILSLVILAAGTALLLVSCKEKPMRGMVVFTRISSKGEKADINSPDKSCYLTQAHIMQIDPSKSEGSLKALTDDFFSARSPKISYDGKYLLFSGQLKQNDPWQIWELDISKMKSRQITKSVENCIDPVYLPGGRIAFSMFSSKDSLKSGHSLFVCGTDGAKMKRITFNPDTYLSSSVLSDGRILSINRQLFPTLSEPQIMVLRPDGTKADVFYSPEKSGSVISPSFETSDGRLIFIESEISNGNKGEVISINYNRPLHSRVVVSSGVEGNFRFAVPEKSGKLLVSYKKEENENLGLYEFDPATKTISSKIYADTAFDVLEAAEVTVTERPKKLPSEVDMGVKTGLLMCQDLNFAEPDRPTLEKTASGIEIMGIDSSLGVVNVADDGSFYLKVMADKPFQIRKIDKDGKIIGAPSAWLWLRPNERRGCVGCHQDPEIVPGNKVPLAVKKAPVSIPVHINKVVEKKVSLE